MLTISPFVFLHTASTHAQKLRSNSLGAIIPHTRCIVSCDGTPFSSFMCSESLNQSAFTQQ